MNEILVAGIAFIAPMLLCLIFLVRVIDVFGLGG